MKKSYFYLACLMFSNHTMATTEQNENIEETYLFCKYEKNIYHPKPTYQIQGWEDESVKITNPGDFFDWLWVDMYGFRYKAEKNSNHISWVAPHSDFENWEYKHRLDRITGVLTVELHVPISAESEMAIKNLDFDNDGIIKQSTVIFKCKQAESIF